MSTKEKLSLWNETENSQDDKNKRRYCRKCVYFNRFSRQCTKLNCQCMGAMQCLHYSETRKSQSYQSDVFGVQIDHIEVSKNRKENSLFSVMEEDYADIAEQCYRAENILFTDPIQAIFKVHEISYQILNCITKNADVEYVKSGLEFDQIALLVNQKVIPDHIQDCFAFIRLCEYKLPKRNYETGKLPEYALAALYDICVWVLENFNQKEVETKVYSIPDDENDPRNVSLKSAQTELENQTENYKLFLKNHEDLEEQDEAAKVQFTLTKNQYESRIAATQARIYDMQMRNALAVKDPPFVVTHEMVSGNDSIVIRFDRLPVIVTENECRLPNLVVENNTGFVMSNVDLEIEFDPAVCKVIHKKINVLKSNTLTMVSLPKAIIAQEELQKITKVDRIYMTAKLTYREKVVATELSDFCVDDEVANIMLERSMQPAETTLLKEEDPQYINPTNISTLERIYIPVGMDKKDHGFVIYGIRKTTLSNNPNATLFALIYNFMTRSNRLVDNLVPSFLADDPNLYKDVYRMAIVLLMMIRHNYTRNSELSVNYDGNQAILRNAATLINYYGEMFCTLIGIPAIKLRVHVSEDGHDISRNGIYTIDANERVTNGRELWFGRKIIYRLGEQQRIAAERLLHELTPFKYFKDGQYEALCKMVNSNDNSVCIMPPASGKSLIVYMAGFLQPLPVFVMEPTETLISDQIRHITRTLSIDTVSHLMTTNDGYFSNYEIQSMFNFLTPMTFNNRELLKNFRVFNSGVTYQEDRIAPGPCVSYIVIDEVHSVAMRSHDFRPEYAMLLNLLINYLPQISFVGLTGTCERSVLEEIAQKLVLKERNVIMPIPYSRYNVNYEFIKVTENSEFYDKVAQIVNECNSRKEKTIVYTKSDRCAKRIYDKVTENVAIYSPMNSALYYEFVNGEVNTLITSDILGIGVDIDGVKNVIHAGLPLSFSEYVQQINRAGRPHEHFTSYVVYLENTEENVPSDLLQKNIDIAPLTYSTDGKVGDYCDISRLISNGCENSESLQERLIGIYNSFLKVGRRNFLLPVKREMLKGFKENLYMLYICGFLSEWYPYKMGDTPGGEDIFVDIYGNNQSSVMNVNGLFLRMRSSLKNFFDSQKDCVEEAFATVKLKNPQEVFKLFADWYYTKFLYHRNSDLVDFYQFVSDTEGQDADSLTEHLSEIFEIPEIPYMELSTVMGHLSYEEICDRVISNFGRKSLERVTHVNSMHYSPQFELCNHLAELKVHGILYKDQADRLLEYISGEQLIECYKKVYIVCDEHTRLQIIDYVHEREEKLMCSLNAFISKVYQDIPKDLVYYGVIAKMANQILKA